MDADGRQCTCIKFLVAPQFLPWVRFLQRVPLSEGTRPLLQQCSMGSHPLFLSSPTSEALEHVAQPALPLKPTSPTRGHP